MPSSKCGETKIPPFLVSTSASSFSRRSVSGRWITGSPSISRTSKSTSASVPVPCWRSEKLERPLSSSAAISPSTTASADRSPRSAARAASRKRSVRSFPRRLVSFASPPATVTIARYPSHFGSYVQSLPSGSASAEVADIGSYAPLVLLAAPSPGPSLRRMSQFCSFPSR